MTEEKYRADVEEVSPVLRKISIEVPKETVEERLDQAFRRLQKKAKVPGFRPGKAPLSVIKTRFKKAVVEDLEEDLINETTREVLREKEIRAVAITRVDDGKYTEGEDFRFTAHVEVLPDFDVEGYDGIEVPEVKAEVTDEDVNDVIEKIREAHAVYKPVDRESREGDLLEISFKSSEGDKVLHETDNSTYEITGKSALGEQFEKELIGRKAGDELEFEISYPEDFELEEVRGKTIKYEIKIKSVKEKSLPEVDDEFARSLKEFQSLEELKERIRQDLLAEREKLGRQLQEAKIVEKLLERNPIEVPRTLVEDEITRMVYDTYRRLWDQGLRFDISKVDMNSMRERYREEAEKNVRLSLILSKIAEKEGIEVTEDDLKKEMNRIAESMNLPPEQVASFYEDEKKKEDLRSHLLDRKVFDVILKNAKLVAEEKGREGEEKTPEKEEREGN